MVCKNALFLSFKVFISRGKMQKLVQIMAVRIEFKCVKPLEVRCTINTFLINPKGKTLM